MAVGVLIPGPAPLPSILDAELPSPLDEALYTAGGLDVGSYSALATPTPAAMTRGGLDVPMAGLAVLDRIHVIPRQADLGAIVSEQVLEVETWNAHRNRTRILDEITIDGPPGVELVDGGQSSHFPPTQSTIYQVRVLTEGDATISNTVTWVFLGVDPDGTNLRVLGVRMVPWAYEPNWGEPVVETYGYLTDLLTAHSGMEQRIQLRAVPVGSIGYSTLLTTLQEVQAANAILFGNQTRPFGVARWQYRVPLTTATVIGATEVPCDTANIPFEAGGLVLLWRDPSTWEVQTISAVLADRLVLSLELRVAWPAGTAVLPMVIGRLAPEASITWESLAIGSTSLTFAIDGFRP